MNFSDKFKKVWWIIILITLTGISIWRFWVGLFTNFDIFVFIFWFILILFPIISEISFFGINVKKDIENAKNEIKGYITEIKNSINFQPVINITTEKAKQNEYENKAKEEIKEEIKEEAKEKNLINSGKSGRAYVWIDNSPELKTEEPNAKENAKERLKKILTVEKLVSENLKAIFEEKFHSQIKITDTASQQSLIVDGAIYKEDNVSVKKIIEIKFITKMSFDRFYFIALNHLKKIIKFGLRIPVEFIIVSEDFDENSAKNIREQIIKINYQRVLGGHIPHISSKTFLFKDEKLEEINHKD